MSKIQALIYGLALLGKPYIYGGNGPDGYDCSGLVSEVLKSSGVLSYAYSDTADGIYHTMQDPLYGKKIDQPEAGALVFFGKGTKIEHVALVLDENRMLEAGGGFKGIKPEQLNEHAAMVRIRPIKMRVDFRAFVMPHYPYDQSVIGP